MQYNITEINSLASKYNYPRDTFEKVYRLMDILMFIQDNPILKDKMALKGGTAINLFLLDLPRLSVDMDFDYAVNSSIEDLMENRELIVNSIKEHMLENSYILSKKSKSYHALDSLVFEYINLGGSKDNIKIEINYVLRAHVLPLIYKTTNISWFNKQLKVLTVNPIEIVSSKICALLNRSAPRDLFDLYQIFKLNLIKDNEINILKKNTIFYYYLSSKETPNIFEFDNVLTLSQYDIKTNLIPVLHKGEWFDCKEALDFVISKLKNILLLNESDYEFWKLLDKSIYKPELLFDEKSILESIKNHPLVIWKLKNN